MKYKMLVVATALMAVVLVGCKKNNPTPEPEPVPVPSTTLDYSKAENWLKYESNPTKEVDMVYIFPTVIMEGQDTVTLCNEEERAKALYAYSIQASAIEPYTNVYMPNYKQVPLNIAATSKDNYDYVRMIRNNDGIKDVFAALDYFFQNANNGRPFILTSHSQGAATLRIVLDDYMKNHPQYYSRMVAAYLLGYGVPQSWLNDNPHLKFATGEEDTGVVLAWACEGPGSVAHSILISGEDMNINPLSWSRNTDYVAASENHGRIENDTIKPGIADAQINAERGVVVCTTITDYVGAPLFGDKSLHGIEWVEYYVNIRENAKTRIEAYLGHSIE